MAKKGEKTLCDFETSHDDSLTPFEASSKEHKDEDHNVLQRVDTRATRQGISQPYYKTHLFTTFFR